LIRLRREHLFNRKGFRSFDGAVLSATAFVLRSFAINAAAAASVVDDDRLLVINLGTELCLTSVPEPLLAPARSAGWETVWSSEDTAYGAAGKGRVHIADRRQNPGRWVVLLASCSAC